MADILDSEDTLLIPKIIINTAIFNIYIDIEGSGGGILSVWKEHTDKLKLLQSQAISEQPVAALDWSPDKKGMKLGRHISF